MNKMTYCPKKDDRRYGRRLATLYLIKARMWQRFEVPGTLPLCLVAVSRAQQDISGFGIPPHSAVPVQGISGHAEQSEKSLGQ